MSDVLDIQGGSELEDTEHVTTKLKSSAKKRKGRGFNIRCNSELEHIRHFDSLDKDDSKYEDNQPQKSVEGWVLFVRGLHEEANEDDVKQVFAEYGSVANICVNMDRRTGFLKGYALIEYKSYEDANRACENLNGTTLLDRTIKVEWTFVQQPFLKLRCRTAW